MGWDAVVINANALVRLGRHEEAEAETLETAGKAE